VSAEHLRNNNKGLSHNKKVWQPLNLPACRRAIFAQATESLENAWFYQKTKRSAPIGVRNVMVKY